MKPFLNIFSTLFFRFSSKFEPLPLSITIGKTFELEFSFLLKKELMGLFEISKTSKALTSL